MIDPGLGVCPWLVWGNHPQTLVQHEIRASLIVACCEVIRTDAEGGLAPAFRDSFDWVHARQGSNLFSSAPVRRLSRLRRGFLRLEWVAFSIRGGYYQNVLSLIFEIPVCSWSSAAGATAKPGTGLGLPLLFISWA
jgi:hypothetical protein